MHACTMYGVYAQGVVLDAYRLQSYALGEAVHGTRMRTGASSVGRRISLQESTLRLESLLTAHVTLLSVTEGRLESMERSRLRFRVPFEFTFYRFI